VNAQIALPPDESRTIGTAVPDVPLIGEDSTSFALSTLAGKPVVVSPIFTTCPHTCAMITTSLRDALASIGEPGVGYHVLTVSFDPADGPSALRRYRRDMNLPAGWTLAAATDENRRQLLDAIDFNYEPMPGGGFAHANVVAILTPTLEVSAYAHGVSYDAKELRGKLEVAARESSLVRHYQPYILLIGVVSVLSLVAVLLATRRKPKPA
jgi:cytochrome oxidase Cu insertion factor (SCO1/SenC/PrrC family)